MRVVRSVAALVAAFILQAAGTQAVAAATLAECQGQLSALQDSTAAAEQQFVNPKSFTSATAVLAAADAKLGEGKIADAVAKLADFRATLEALAAASKPKVDAGTAADLIAEAEAVEACMASITP